MATGRGLGGNWRQLTGSLIATRGRGCSNTLADVRGCSRTFADVRGRSRTFAYVCGQSRMLDVPKCDGPGLSGGGNWRR